MGGNNLWAEMTELASDDKHMNDNKGEREPRRKFWIVFLFLFVLSAAVSVTMWAFSFYALAHYQKLLVLGYLGLLFGLLTLRFVYPFVLTRPFNRKWIVLSALIAVVITAVGFVLTPYHQAPIRTQHILTIVNSSSHTDLIIDKIGLPGDAIVDLITEFPDAEVVNGNLILSDNESLTYTREMAGGLDVVIYLDRPGIEVEIYWDGIEQQVNLPDNTDAGDKAIISLPGWSWGEPSILYRTLGWVNIVADYFTAAGLLFCSFYWLLTRKSKSIETGNNFSVSQKLIPYTIPILINLGVTVLSAVNQIWITGRMLYSFVLMAAGIISFIPYIFVEHRKWIIRTAFILIILGVLFNLYVFIAPYYADHLTLSALPDNSFSTLASKADDSTYLSLGYYRYFRNADLHIPADAVTELNLNIGRLKEMNIGMNMIRDPYEYTLDRDIAEQLLKAFVWQVWPRETGGNFYLSLHLTSPGDDLYFFESGDHYFLVSDNFLVKSGMFDVSILN